MISGKKSAETWLRIPWGSIIMGTSKIFCRKAFLNSSLIQASYSKAHSIGSIKCGLVVIPFGKPDEKCIFII